MTGVQTCALPISPHDCERVATELRARGILVRSMAKKPVIDGSFRLTIGTMPEMERVVAALADVIARVT